MLLRVIFGVADQTGSLIGTGLYLIFFPILREGPDVVMKRLFGGLAVEVVQHHQHGSASRPKASIKPRKMSAIPMNASRSSTNLSYRPHLYDD